MPNNNHTNRNRKPVYIEKHSCIYDDTINKLSESVIKLNESVINLSSLLPTLATKDDIYNIKDDVDEVRAMARDGKTSKDRAYWIITIVAAAGMFFIGFMIP